MVETPEQVAGIVKSLTKAQRDAMVRIYPNVEPTALFPGDPSLGTLGTLAKAGLLASPPYSRNQRFTPLGLAVRSALIALENDRGE